jgi:uncharacterized membrane protein YgdD (TMEM256/DUF423 family)
VRRALSIITGCAGLLGAAGVTAAGAAAHLGGGQLLETAATFLMVHAAAVIGIAALAERVAGRATLPFVAAALLLIVGMILFCGDFAMRAIANQPLFHMAAPTGGTLLIAGWLAAALGGFIAGAARMDESRR